MQVITLILARVTLFVILLAACNHVDGITPRSYVGLLVAHAGSLRGDIAKSIKENPGKDVPQAGVLQLPPLAGTTPLKYDFGWVTTKGVVIFHSKQYGVVVVLEPVILSNEVKWSCEVHPTAAKPSLCGSE